MHKPTMGLILACRAVIVKSGAVLFCRSPNPVSHSSQQRLFACSSAHVDNSQPPEPPACPPPIQNHVEHRRYRSYRNIMGSDVSNQSRRNLRSFWPEQLVDEKHRVKDSGIRYSPRGCDAPVRFSFLLPLPVSGEVRGVMVFI